jgi:serine/threonine-protein kinase
VTAGQTLANRYVLGRVLGRGGMGSVYAAHDDVLDREVAVKLLPVADAPSDAHERFRREAQFLAGLAHPNVVTVFDFGIDDEQAWLVMELLPGPTLAELVAAEDPLPVATVAAFGRECAAALAAAHESGVVHRDVKPANVMLSDDGRCKLLDLGIARLAETTGHNSATLTQTGMIIGTVPFLAPEVINGGQATPAVDAYALGGLLFTLLTAHPPYQAETAVATLTQHVNAPVPHPADERPEVPDALDALVVEMLAKGASGRPTAAAAEQRLANLAATIGLPGGLAAAAAAPDPTRVLTAPVSASAPGRRHQLNRLSDRAVLAAILGMLVLLVVALVVFRSNGSPASRSLAHPAAHRTSAVMAPTKSSARPAQTTESVSSRLTELQTAIDQAAASGALQAPDAQDFRNRSEDLGRTISAGNAQDAAHKVDDFAHHLNDVSKQGHITRAAYTSILAALQALRNAA